jgi:hypothetical protein
MNSTAVLVGGKICATARLLVLRWRFALCGVALTALRVRDLAWGFAVVLDYEIDFFADLELC